MLLAKNKTLLAPGSGTHISKGKTWRFPPEPERRKLNQVELIDSALQEVARRHRLLPALLWHVRMWQTRKKKKKRPDAAPSQKPRDEETEKCQCPPWKFVVSDLPHQ